MKIRNNLFYLSGGLYGQLGNVYAFKHDNGYGLVDAGTPASYEKIVENLNYWGISEKEVTHVLLTHGHDDHAGSASYFQALGARIILGKEDNYMLQLGNFSKESPFANHQMPKCSADILIEEDTHMTIGGVEIDVYTMPGHTDGFLVYYIKLDNDYVLFSGDMFYCDGEKGDIAYTGWKGDMNYNSEKLGNSFMKLWNLDLSPTVVLGGHGNPRIGQEAKDQIMIAYKYYLINNR